MVKLLKYSNDYGQTRTTVTNKKFTVLTMSYNSENIYNVSPYNKVIISINNNIIRNVEPTVPTTGSNYFKNSNNSLYIYNGTA